MASVVRRELGDGTPSFYVKWRGADGRDRWEHIGRGNLAREAKKRAAQIEVEVQKSGGLYERADVKTTLSQFVLDGVGETPSWVDTIDVRDATRSEYRRLLKSPTGFLNAYGHLPLPAIKRSHVREWMTKRAQAGRSRNTIRNELAPVRAALEQAVEDKKINENPALISRRGKKGKLPGREPKKIIAPAAATVALAIESATGDFPTVLLLAASCGLRLGEVYGLRWKDLASDWRTLTVVCSNHRGTITDPKTEAGARTVPIFPTVRKALKEHKVASRFVAPDDLVFPDVLGRPQSPAAVSEREMRATFKKAGLPERAFTFHSLRHFAVSRLIEDGANILLVSKIAGHASADITLRVYAHLMSDGADKAADAYDPAVAIG